LFLTCLLNTVVFGAIDGCNNNRRDSDVSVFDIFCIPGHVGLPFLLNIFSALTVLQSLFGEPDSLDLRISERLVLHTKDPSSESHIPSNRLEVTVTETYHGEYPMSQANHHGSYPSSGAQFTNKQHEHGSDDNVESRDEKQ
jgi:hypothetical protein